MFLYDTVKGFAINTDHIISIMIGSEKDAIVPTKEGARIRIMGTKEHHHAVGKKMKGHGGS